MIPEYNKQQKEFQATTIKNYPQTTRLYKEVKKYVGELQNGYCWHCGENKIVKLVWCDRCFFYVKNQFNDLMYPEQQE